jgi:heat shock protein HslJ
MKSIIYLVLFAFALTMSVSSCNKEEANILLKEMLIKKSWKFSSMKIMGVETIKDCNKDDIMSFEENGTYLSTCGASTCNAGETNTTGSWTLSDNGKTITIGSTRYSIVITESKLVIAKGDGINNIELTLIPA